VCEQFRVLEVLEVLEVSEVCEVARSEVGGLGGFRRPIPFATLRHCRDARDPVIALTSGRRADERREAEQAVPDPARERVGAIRHNIDQFCQEVESGGSGGLFRPQIDVPRYGSGKR